MSLRNPRLRCVRRWLAGGTLAGALLGTACQSRVTLEVLFVLPDSLQPVDLKRIAVRSEQEHTGEFGVPEPEPGPDRGDGCGPYLAHARGVLVRCSFIGNSVKPALAAWYDLDNNGGVNRGDWIGVSEPVVVRTSLFSLEGIGQAPEVVMTEVGSKPQNEK